MCQIISDINAVLQKHGITETISIFDVTITENTVSDWVKETPKLSVAITNYLWPSIPSAEVYHYTSREIAESILQSKIFRLSNIEKRLSDGEISTFCKTHNLSGYLEENASGEPRYKHMIAANTFYASFTDSNLTDEQEQYFWNNFAQCDGVRLKMKITASNPNFRKIHYEPNKGEPIPLIEDLRKCIKISHNREFILQGISRLCSFYLSGKDYGVENEYRALCRTWDWGPQPIGIGKNSYIEIPLNRMSDCGYQFEIEEVHAVKKPKMSAEYNFSKRTIK